MEQYINPTLVHGTITMFHGTITMFHGTITMFHGTIYLPNSGPWNNNYVPWNNIFTQLWSYKLFIFRCGFFKLFKETLFIRGKFKINARPLLPTLLYIYFACLSVLVFVFLYPINVTYMTPGKVNGCSEFKKCVSKKV